MQRDTHESATSAATNDAQDELTRQATELARLRAVNLRLERYAAAVAHDLAAPLRAIHGNLTLALRRHKGAMAPDLLALIEEAESGAQRLRASISGHLALARNSATAERMAAVSLADVVDEVRTSLAADLAACGGVLRHAALPTVWGRADLLSLLLQNLVQNALRYRDAQPPEVWLSAEAQGDRWCVTVKDNGVGIDPAVAHTLLEPDVRGASASSQDGGLGLGLHTCSLIASRHGGQVWLEPGEGGGTVARFTLAGAEEGQ